MNRTPLPIGTRYTLKDKARRNELIRQYHLDHPDLILEELAAMFDLAISRIWVILHEKDNREE